MTGDRGQAHVGVSVCVCGGGGVGGLFERGSLFFDNALPEKRENACMLQCKYVFENRGEVCVCVWGGGGGEIEM